MTTMNYYLHGKDDALLKEELEKLLNTFNEGDVKNANIFDGNAPDFNVLNVLEDVNTISLFGDENKIVVLKNPAFLYSAKAADANTLDELTAYFENPSPFSTLVIYWDEKSFGKDEGSKQACDKFSKLLKAKCEETEIKALDPESFKARVKKDIKEKNINIDPNALETLFELLSNDVSIWLKEAEKLSLYGLKITKEDLPFLITRTLEDKTYELTNAIMNKDLKRTMWIWDDLLQDKNNDPKKLIVMIANNFRKQYEAIILSRSMSNEEIAKVLHMPKSAAVYHLLKHQKDFPLNRIYYLLDKLADLDQSIKSYNTDPRLACELFFIEAIR